MGLSIKCASTSSLGHLLNLFQLLQQNELFLLLNVGCWVLMVAQHLNSCASSATGFEPLAYR